MYVILLKRLLLLVCVILRILILFLNFLVNHYKFFPRAIGQIFQSYNARELHLTFTQGRWNYEDWGYPIVPSAGIGVELWAWLWKDGKYVISFLGRQYQFLFFFFYCY